MKLLFLQLDSEQYFFSFFYNDPLDVFSVHFQNLNVKNEGKNCQGFSNTIRKFFFTLECWSFPSTLKQFNSASKIIVFNAKDHLPLLFFAVFRCMG